jgi:hypothetical protein
MNRAIYPDWRLPRPCNVFDNAFNFVCLNKIALILPFIEKYSPWCKLSKLWLGKAPYSYGTRTIIPATLANGNYKSKKTYSTVYVCLCNFSLCIPHTVGILYVCGVAIGYICMSYVRLELECGDGRGEGVISQSTYVCIVQSSVWHLPKYWPSPPSPPSECVLPPHQRRGGTHSLGGEGEGGQYFGRRQTLDWPPTV